MIHVLLAAYNEERALGPVLDGIAHTIADGNYRIWVVDDGSTDGTARVAEDRSSLIPLTLIRHEFNRGLGAALQTGLSHLLPVIKNDDVVVTLDADNTHPPQLISRMNQPIEDGKADIVIASRFAPGGEVVGVPSYRRLTSWGVMRLFRCIIPIAGVRDYTCGYRAYKGEMLRRGAERWGRLVTETGFAAMVEWLVRMSTFAPRIFEVPLVLRYDRKPGPSKMPVLRTILRTLWLLARLRAIRAS